MEEEDGHFITKVEHGVFSGGNYIKVVDKK